MHVLILKPSPGISNCLFLRDFVFIFTTRRHSLFLNFISVSHSDLYFSYTHHIHINMAFADLKLRLAILPFTKKMYLFFFFCSIYNILCKQACWFCSPLVASVPPAAAVCRKDVRAQMETSCCYC